MDREAVGRLAEQPIGWQFKGMPARAAAMTVREFVASSPSLRSAGFSFPLLVLDEAALDHNIATMAAYCRERGVALAPHGKTTMAPQLYERQVRAGAWGMTAATTSQVRVYRQFGVNRILLANQLVDADATAWLADELERDPDFEFLCYVDSVDGVRLLASALDARPGRRRIGVLVEIGPAGGRTGARTVESAVEVARSASEVPRLRVAGVAGYEGGIGYDADPATLARVRAFVELLRDGADAVIGAGLCAAADEMLVSCGGSAYFDVVTAVLVDEWRPVARPTVLLRCGSYVTHDIGLYAGLSPFDRSAAPGGPLKPALRLWAAVLSRPEPDLVIVGAGKRDASYDCGLPRPELVWRRDEEGPRTVRDIETLQLNDHHAFLRAGPAAVPIEVGDLVGFGLSHPCTAFDKWRLIPVLDDGHRLTGCIQTFF